MKLRTIVILSLAVLFSLVLAFAHGKKDAAKKTSDKKSECCVAGTKASDDCSAAEKAHCDAAKSGKMTMKKMNGKMDCCKDKAKEANGKTETKSKAEGKGTN